MSRPGSSLPESALSPGRLIAAVLERRRGRRMRPEEAEGPAILGFVLFAVLLVAFILSMASLRRSRAVTVLDPDDRRRLMVSVAAFYRPAGM